MKEVYVVEAAHDENGNLSYGAKGDQTGDEVRRRPLGTEPKEFTYILRYPDETIARSIAEDAEECADNDHIGYAQQGKDNLSSRYGLYFAMQGKDRFADITTDCNVDCSALVADILIHNGLKVSRFMYTGDEVESLTKIGFKKMDYTKLECRPGDVLWRSGHTAVVVGAESAKTHYKGILTASDTLDKWTSGAGFLTREAPFIRLKKEDIGFTPGLICIQQAGEVISVTQWMREQKEGYLYCANYANDATAGIAVGTGQGYFNPDADELKIPVRFPGRKYIVHIYKE